GLVLDIVPNHMAASPDHNPWWRDVLARGAESAYANHFDIDWHSPDPDLHGRVLLPILGKPYWEALCAGELTLGFDARAGQPVLVFEAVHGLVFQLFRDGWIDGVRVDHVDGLADPATYCQRLRARLTALAPERPPARAIACPWLVIEKILAGHETLRADWLVDGTTGYDFMNEVAAVLHDGAGADALTALWR